MPATSRAQLKAMYAAAEGKSSLGIPASVGKEFVQATPSAKALPTRAPKTRAPRRNLGSMPMHPGQEPLPNVHTSKHH